MCGGVWYRQLQRFPQLKNRCHMGFTEAVNDSIYASLACLIIGLGYTPLSITRCCTPICIPPLHSCFVSKYTNKFVIVKCLIFFFTHPPLTHEWFHPTQESSGRCAAAG